MATKTFLTSAQVIAAREILRPPGSPPDGDERKIGDFSALEFSQWLGERLCDRLSRHADWPASEPIALGSWSRGELAPKSDIDILFVGDESAVKRLCDAAFGEGLKLRYRMPKDLCDWSVGVEPFDVLALFSARALTVSSEEKLRQTQAALLERPKKFRRELLIAIRNERRERAQRFDSISNYLEPNLKYGPGGLRDLEQAMMIRRLFPERFASQAAHSAAVLNYYKQFFLTVRHRLHLMDGTSDLLAAAEQAAVAEWLGYSSTRDFMRELQKGLSRVSFYADWTMEFAVSSAVRIKGVNEISFKSIEDLFAGLKADPSLLMQNRVRRAADEIFFAARKSPTQMKLTIGRCLREILADDFSENLIVAVFRSRLIDHCVSDFRRIVGHVQHDQYHRFTVDAHILQALRELKRVIHRPSQIGALQAIFTRLTKRDLLILSFSCLYHDIAKGLEGDHSVLGMQIARDDLRDFGFKKEFIDDVVWLVEEHLTLSKAAFRENPRSPRVWQKLLERGAEGRRLWLLTVFTVIDIRATNPEAWTPWKERLLFDLVTQLERSEASSVVQFASAVARENFPDGWVELFDPFLLASLPIKQLVRDLSALASDQTKSVSALPLALRVRGGKQTWVRFHSRVDEKGLFLQYVTKLSRAGLGIRHASILTDPELGVYDWFETKTSRSPAQVRKLLSLSDDIAANDEHRRVRFSSIDAVSYDHSEWVISFRGKDQAGALLAAAQALFDEGLNIRWAKVHTWGRQIDDVFGVAVPTVHTKSTSLGVIIESLLQNLRSKWT